ncbi:MAG TPA: hypothetical protein VGH16_23840, partial [Candidatus Binatia bacterium]
MLHAQSLEVGLERFSIVFGDRFDNYSVLGQPDEAIRRVQRRRRPLLGLRRVLILKIDQSRRELPRSGIFAGLGTGRYGRENQTAGDNPKRISSKRVERVKKCHFNTPAKIAQIPHSATFGRD